jgi:amino acid permease
VCWKERFDLDQSFASPGVFSSVVMAQFSYSTNPVTSLSVQERITPSETTPVQTETTKAKMEEDTDIDEWPETLRDVEQ